MKVITLIDVNTSLALRCRFGLMLYGCSLQSYPASKSPLCCFPVLRLTGSGPLPAVLSMASNIFKKAIPAQAPAKSSPPGLADSDRGDSSTRSAPNEWRWEIGLATGARRAPCLWPKARRVQFYARESSGSLPARQSRTSLAERRAGRSFEGLPM